MYFATKLKAVSGKMALDTAGRSLTFIGSLPVKAGDWVFTDGRFIFGNVHSRGSPVIDEEQSGIPILADNLRGYINKTGRFRKFNVAQDDWITNSKKKFSHGQDFIAMEKTIDADFDSSGNKLFVTGGIYRNNQILNSTYVVFSIIDTRAFRSAGGFRYVVALYPAVFEHTLGSRDFSAKKSNALLYVGDIKKGELDLKPYVDDVEQRALLCADSIYSQSFKNPVAYVTASGRLEYKPTPIEDITRSRRQKRDDATLPWGLVNRPADPPPDKPLLAHTCAQVLTCSFDGKKISGLIFASAYGYCFPRIQPRFLFYCGGLTGFMPYEFKCVPFGFSAFYKIDSLEPIAYRAFGGISSDFTTISYSYPMAEDLGTTGPDGKSVGAVTDFRHDDLLPNSAQLDLNSSALFPVGDGFFSMDNFGRISFYNSKGNKVAENIPIHDRLFHIEILEAFFPLYSYLYYLNDKPSIKFNIYLPDGSCTESNFNLTESDLIKINEKISVPPIDGFYILNDNDVVESLQFTPLFYQLRDEVYLYGVKDSKLYLKKKGVETFLDDGIKNFRLQELKNINRARR